MKQTKLDIGTVGQKFKSAREAKGVTVSEAASATKILTKFSNEYSNLNFIIYVCNKLKCQKEELFNLINYNDTKLDELTIQEKKRIFKLYNKTYS